MTHLKTINDLSSHYVKLMQKHALLSATEEYALAKKWSEDQDPAALKKLVESHFRLINKVANGYRGYGLPMSDLISEGNIGMMQALKHFNPEKGFRLSTYALWWVRAAIQDYILRSWSLVRLGTTSNQRRLFFNLRRQKRDLDIHGREDFTPEMISHIAQKLEVTEEEVLHMNQRLAGSDYSLNTLVNTTDEGGSATEWVEWLVDERDDQETAIIAADETQKRKILLEKALEHLTAREYEIIVARRLCETPATLESLSQKLHLSRERVRQIEITAFTKLQKAVRRLNEKLSEEA